MNLVSVKKLNIPKNPGCYLFKNSEDKVIYVGKAVDLRSRVLSYFRASATHSEAKYKMLKEIKKIDWIEVESEIEALLLEANLIKRYQPIYNISLRDDKRHVYIKVSTEDEWPRVFMTRELSKSGKYFGPFTSVEAVRETLRVIRKIWPYRSCQNLPKKVCLYYRIGKCPGVCEEKIEQKEYVKIIKQIILFLEGRKKEVIREIERQILVNSKQTTVNSEKTVRNLKYQLINLKKVLEHTNILSLVDKYASDVVELAKVLALPKVPERIEGYDISNIFGREAVGSMVVFKNGEAERSGYRKFKIKITESGGDVAMLKEILTRRMDRLSEAKWSAPDLLIIDGGKAQLNVASSVLKKYNLDIAVLAVSKGEGLRSAGAPDKIFFPGEKKPLELPLSSPALHIIKRVRDEAHRFAITYHRQLRAKNFVVKRGTRNV